MRTYSCLLVVLTVLVGETLGSGLTPLSRWSRQAVHCQPGDEACRKCSTSCNSVEPSHLPECCEAYNSCCDEYFQACKKCSSLTAKDRFFPEYCCASFTDCCHLITTFTTVVKPPEPVKTSTKSQLKIPTEAAPKPTVFPGLQPSQPAAAFTPQQAPSSFFDSPAFDIPGAPSFQSQSSQVPVFQPQVPQAPAVQSSPPRAPAAQPPGRGSGRRVPSQTRTQDRQRPRQRQQGGRRPPQLNLGDRTGRVTSRGRVI